MKNLGYYNGKYGLIEKMYIPMSDRSHWFGDGVYDTAYSYNYKIVALKEHIDRFFNSAELLRIRLGFSKEYLEDLLNDLIKKLDTGNLFIYWQATRGGEGIRSHNYDPEKKANLWITMVAENVTDRNKIFKLISVEDTRFLHCNIKTLNLIPSVTAYQLARQKGCDEAVFHRGDIVTECAHSNIHILKNGIFITHPADEYILPGIARKHLIKACHALDIPVQERTYTLTELLDADEIIISSCGDMCISANEIDGKTIGGKDKILLNKLQDYIYEEYFSAAKN